MISATSAIKYIALSGLICSGKTTIKSFLITKGFFTIDLDDIVHDLSIDRGPLAIFLKSQGVKFFKNYDDLIIDRSYLRSLFFSCYDFRVLLEQFLHPLVDQKVQILLRKYQPSQVILVLPLLINSQNELIDWVTKLDYMIGLKVPVHVQKSRLMARGIDPGLIPKILKTQEPQREIISYLSDSLVVNDEQTSYDMLYRKVMLTPLFRKD